MTDRETLVQHRTHFEDFLLFLYPHHICFLHCTPSCEYPPSRIHCLTFWLGRGNWGKLFMSSNGKKSFLLTHKLPVTCSAQEKNYKIILWWYRYPILLHRMCPSVSNKCWNCENAPGTMLHIWWDCSIIFALCCQPPQCAPPSPIVLVFWMCWHIL